MIIAVFIIAVFKCYFWCVASWLKWHFRIEDRLLFSSTVIFNVVLKEISVIYVSKIDHCSLQTSVIVLFKPRSQLSSNLGRCPLQTSVIALFKPQPLPSSNLGHSLQTLINFLVKPRSLVFWIKSNVVISPCLLLVRPNLVSLGLPFPLPPLVLSWRRLFLGLSCLVGGIFPLVFSRMRLFLCLSCCTGGYFSTCPVVKAVISPLVLSWMRLFPRLSCHGGGYFSACLFLEAVISKPGHHQCLGLCLGQMQAH